MLFPEIEELPHNDTLMRLLERIDVSEIEEAQLALVRGGKTRRITIDVRDHEVDGIIRCKVHRFAVDTGFACRTRCNVEQTC